MKNISAIVYTSNTGHSEEYARLLGEATGLPVYDLKNSSELAKGSEIIYIGWLMAGSVKGYKKAAKRFHVQALCGVGMAPTGTQLDDIRDKNHLPASVSVFSVQGGFEMDKLHGIYKMMMKTMLSTFGKSLEKKEQKTEEEQEMLDLMFHGKRQVNVENLDELLKWYRS